MKKDDERIIYLINVRDIQQVVGEEFDRKLSKKELELVEDKLGEFIDWYGAIQNTINFCELGRKSKNK
jgi:hypothetical protein